MCLACLKMQTMHHTFKKGKKSNLIGQVCSLFQCREGPISDGISILTPQCLPIGSPNPLNYSYKK